MSIDDRTQQRLDNWFQYHPPEGDQAARYTEIRAAGKAFAETLCTLCPDSADRSAALRHAATEDAASAEGEADRGPP